MLQWYAVTCSNSRAIDHSTCNFTSQSSTPLQALIKTLRQSNRMSFGLIFWFAVIPVTQSGGIIRCSRPHVNHNARLNYSSPHILFMTVFSHATWKFEKSQFAGRNRAAKTFHRDRDAFISPTDWESCGMQGSHSADKPYHLYIARIMLRLWMIFFLYAKHLQCYLGKFIK